MVRQWSINWQECVDTCMESVALFSHAYMSIHTHATHMLLGYVCAPSE